MSEHEESGKLWTIIKWVLIAMVILLVLAWFLGGGAAAAWRAGSRFTNPINFFFGNGTTTGTLIQLPWQPAAVRGPDISQFAQQEDQELAQINSGNATSQTNNPKSFGNPSPYAGDITIGDSYPSASDPDLQYVELDASNNAPAPIDLTGWSLQSAISSSRAYLPEATPLFVAGAVNSVEPVVLSPGQSAIVTTGGSPVGVSFEENVCTGYLAQVQKFTPPLSQSCPDPSSALPETAQNEETYGSSCFQFLSSLPRCTFPLQVPSGLSGACVQYVQNTMSYDGCVQQYRASASFALPTWRLYLDLQTPLWHPTHDTIRLLDAQGQVVDAYSY